MTSRLGPRSRAACRYAWWLVFTACLAGCGRAVSSSTASHAPPAVLERTSQETELARVKLTSAAERRLGITLAAVKEVAVSRRRQVGGEVMIPSGHILIVTAPVAGTVQAPLVGQFPVPGRQVQAADELLLIKPLLSPERDVPTPAERVQMANARATLLAAQAVAEGDFARTQAEVEAAKIALQRAEQLLKDRAGSAKTVDDARAQLNIAQVAMRANAERRERLDQLVRQLDGGVAGGAAELSVMAPQPGVIRNLTVSPGQAVSAGVPLMEIVNLDPVWVRVPLYVGLLPEIDAAAEAKIASLGRRQSAQPPETAPPKLARPIDAPPSADPLASSVDRYFELANADHALTPGERVSVEVALRGTSSAIAIPLGAVLYDIHGGTWVYVLVGERVYERRRIQIDSIDDQQVVLAAGPASGEQVVVDGAAELFGIEFGAGK